MCQSKYSNTLADHHSTYGVVKMGDLGSFEKPRAVYEFFEKF